MQRVKNRKAQDKNLNCMKKIEVRNPLKHYKMYVSVKLG